MTPLRLAADHPMKAAPSGGGSVLNLAARIAWASKARIFSLAVFVALAILVYMTVSEISRASVASLNEAIAGDIGAEGTYSVKMRGPFVLDTQESLTRVGQALETLGYQIKQSNEILGEFTPDCPPFEILGSVQVALQRDSRGFPAKLDFGNEALGTELCIGGIRLPSDGVYFPDDKAQSRMGSYFFVHEKYVPAFAGARNGDRVLEVFVVSGSVRDDTQSIVESLEEEFNPEISLNGLQAGELFSVIRANQGADVREASRGVQVVYSAIGWGVLGVSMIGLLISENIVVRQRSWFFGLVRSMGASRGRVAMLVLMDVLLVAISGLLIASVGALLGQGLLTSFITDMTGVREVALLRVDNFARVSLTVLIVLSAAAIIPAWLATRQDPLEVLEPKRT